MADPNAIKAGDAYVEMTLDKSKLDKGLADTGKSAESGADKLGGMDKRAKQLASSLLRVTGAMAMIQVSAAAIEGAFSQMAAERAGTRAWYRGDLQGQVAEMRKVEAAQESWMRSIPILGGTIGKLFDAFKDRSIEEFAAQIQAADQHGQALENTLKNLAAAQRELAKMSGASALELEKMSKADKQRALDLELGKKKMAYDDAARTEKGVRDKLAALETERKAIGTVAQIGRGLTAIATIPAKYRKDKQIEVVQAELTAAQVNTIAAKRDLNASLKVREVESKVSEKKVEAATPKAERVGAERVGMQSGAALAGASASGVAWGAGAVETRSPDEQLVEIQTAQSEKFDMMTAHLAEIAVNTAKPLPNSGQVN